MIKKKRGKYRLIVLCYIVTPQADIHCFEERKMLSDQFSSCTLTFRRAVFTGILELSSEKGSFCMNCIAEPMWKWKFKTLL